MMRPVILSLVVAAAFLPLSSCAKQSNSQAPAALVSAANALEAGTALADLPAPKSEGEKLFNANCAICHAAGKLYPGYFKLQQNGAAQPSITKRGGLEPDYVKIVVRQGIGAMPSFTPTHVTDADLDKIAKYLAEER